MRWYSVKPVFNLKGIQNCFAIGVKISLRLDIVLMYIRTSHKFHEIAPSLFMSSGGVRDAAEVHAEALIKRRSLQYLI